MFKNAVSFNQDLSGWSLPLPPPLGFDEGASAWVLSRPNFLFSGGEQGFHVNVEEAIRLNKAAIGSKTSGFTAEELAACVAFQDSAGTLPVTAMEQPLGLILDTKAGVPVIGSQLVTNGGFDTDTDWTKGTDWVIGSGVATKTAGTASTLTPSTAIVPTVGRWYVVEYTITRTAGSLSVSIGAGTGAAKTASGTYSEILCASTPDNLTLSADATFAGTVDSVSVRELPGNHFVQPSNAPSRPIVSRRVNLMPTTTTTPEIVAAIVDFSDVDGPVRDVFTITKTEEGTNKGHVFSGTITISPGNYFVRMVATAGGVWQFDGGVSLGVTYAGEQHRIIYGAALSAGWTSSLQITPIGSGWFEVIGTFTATSTLTSKVRFGTSGALADIGAPMKIGEIDLRLSIDANLPPYQRVTSPTDYDEVGFPAYARFDGINYWLETGGTVDMTSTDEVTVLAGVTKLSDAARGQIVEFGGGTDNGAFNVFNFTDGRLYFENRGTIVRSAASSVLTGPIKALLTGIGKISTDTALLRINGAQVATNSADQGTGNYGDYKFYMGSRGGASLPFNGRIYGITVIGKLLTESELVVLEQWHRRMGRIY